MIKVTLQKIISQVAKQREINAISTYSAINNRAIRRDPILSRIHNYFSDQRTDSKRKMYYFLLRLHVLYGSVFPRQAVIGEFADIGREQVNHNIADMERAGLLKRTNRGYMTCLYHLPGELNSLKVLKQLTDLFPWLKTLPILLMSLSNHSSGSTNLTPIFQESLKLLNIYKLTGERGRYFYNKWEISNKRKTVNQLISAVNKNISANLGLTEYAMLLNTAFDDETLQIAYDLTVNNKHKAKNVYAYFFGLCRTISEKMDKRPNYSLMYSLVNAAGFKPGDRTMLACDDEAQPRYDQPKNKPEILANRMNPFLAKYGIPEWALDNDKLKV